MKKTIISMQVILLILFHVLLSRYLWIEDIFILFLLPILLILVISGLLGSVIRIFRRMDFKAFMLRSFIGVSILQAGP